MMTFGMSSVEKPTTTDLVSNQVREVDEMIRHIELKQMLEEIKEAQKGDIFIKDSVVINSKIASGEEE